MDMERLLHCASQQDRQDSRPPDVRDTSATQSQGSPSSESPILTDPWVPLWLIQEGFVPQQEQQVLSILGQGCAPPSRCVGCCDCCVLSPTCRVVRAGT